MRQINRRLPSLTRVGQESSESSNSRAALSTMLMEDGEDVKLVHYYQRDLRIYPAD
jgi:hypothetical protein